MAAAQDSWFAASLSLIAAVLAIEDRSARSRAVTFEKARGCLFAASCSSRDELSDAKFEAARICRRQAVQILIYGTFYLWWQLNGAS